MSHYGKKNGFAVHTDINKHSRTTITSHIYEQWLPKIWQINIQYHSYNTTQMFRASKIFWNTFFQ